MSTFRGGIHPYEGKTISMNKPTLTVQPKGDMVFPVSQHIGAPASPIVAVGDVVLVGQKIAEATGFVSSPVISSVSGKVKAIEPRQTVDGSKVMSIIIENDEEYKAVEGFGKERDYTKLSKDEIKEIVKEAGIVGMGGAGFPTHVKLAPKEPEKIDHVIVNAAECEPYLTSDYRMLLEEPEKVIGGLKVMLSLFDGAKGVIAIEDNKPEAIKKLQELTANESNITVKVLKTKYPQGAERQIIYMVTGRKIGSDKLPADAGCIVDNVDTVIGIYNAVCLSTPLIRRIITLTGEAVREPVNVNVRIGMHYAEMVKQAGGFGVDPKKIISGGPMMGKALSTLDIPVTKTSSSLLALAKDDVADSKETACIRCGRCVAACPMQLVPTKMAAACRKGDKATFEKLHGMECYGCGSCTYVCPAKKQLTQLFVRTRSEILADRKKK
ncbi:MAG: electron transport complex subunit RsxC [Lachnospiraceae bacterium]|nr:electron transport complex subunit RsxC [Lachnospiraceae bacterium]